MKTELDLLKEKITALEKTNQVLIKKLQSKQDSKDSSFSTFERNVLLNEMIQQKTDSLRQATEKMKTILNTLPGSVFLYDQTFQIQESYFGVNSFQTIKSKAQWTQLVQTQPFLDLLKQHSANLSHNQGRFSFDATEIVGHFFYLEIFLAPVESSLFIFINDISENTLLSQKLKEQQAALIVTSKLSSLGEMAAGIAHEINTPLTAIQMRVDLVKAMIEGPSLDPKKAVEKLDHIHEIVKRISKIIRSLRDLTRSDETRNPEGNKPRTDLSEIMKDVLVLCSEKCRLKSINLILDPSLAQTQTLPIAGSRVELCQVVTNLLNNAYDAVGEQNNSWIKVRTETPSSKSLLLIVEDSGGGIPDQISKQLFEPFFTTKARGQGTGLGLSLSKVIAEKNNAKLSYTGQPGITRFQLQIPLEETA